MVNDTVTCLNGARMAAVPGVVHGFTTREGGVSLGGCSSLNLAVRAGDPPECVQENWRRVALRFGVEPAQIAVLSQVHGNRVLRVFEGRGALQPVGEADAAVCTVSGVLLAVRVADCVPVLFAAPGGIAVAHAGWRGVALQVVQRTVEALCMATGARPDAVVASIGPHISQPAFEVGEEVVEALVASGVAPEGWIDRTGVRPHVDLGFVVREQLRGAGVISIDHLESCTYFDQRFFSHRRDGDASGRFAGVIAMKGSR